MKESDVPLLKNHTINEKENEDDAKEKLNNKVNEAKNNPKKIWCMRPDGVETKEMTYGRTSDRRSQM